MTMSPFLEIDGRETSMLKGIGIKHASAWFPGRAYFQSVVVASWDSSQELVDQNPRYAISPGGGLTKVLFEMQKVSRKQYYEYSPQIDSGTVPVGCQVHFQGLVVSRASSAMLIIP